jgi:hypothetical protein
MSLPLSSRTGCPLTMLESRGFLQPTPLRGELGSYLAPNAPTYALVSLSALWPIRYGAHTFGRTSAR